jgi:uncharacterized membrane protein (DUF373 family)
VLIALLAILRKLIILDLSTTDAAHLFALATAIVALGGVYWLIRYQDRRKVVPASEDVGGEGDTERER